MVSARKNKARLDKSALTRLKKKNADSQAKEMELSPEALGRIGDELVNATIQGFNEELATQPAPIRALAKQFSGLIEEFFKGFKEGVNAEISEFVKNNRKISETTIEDIEKVTTTNIKALAETVTDVVEEEKKPAEPLTKEKTDEAISTILARKEGNAGAVLDKKFNFKDFLTRAGLGAIGQEDAAEDIIAKRQEKEAFVQTETKLRSEEFKGMSSEDVRKKLEEDYKTIQTTTQELKKLEEQISTYKDMGYSPEQMEKLGVDEKKKELVQQAIKADPSRMSEYTKYIQGDTTTNNDNRQPSTTISNTDTGTRITNFRDEAVKTSSSAMEENFQEQTIIQQEAAKEQSNQTTLLSEIRDLLKKQREKVATTPETPKAAAESESGSGMPDLDLPGKGTRAAGKGGAGKALKSMLPKGAALKSAAGFAAAGAVMLGVTNAVDTGLGKLGVGKDAEGNALKIDEQQDDENWKKASFFEKAQSALPRGIEKVGSFLGWDSITTQARAERIKSETEYLKKKHATVEDVKKSEETTIGVNFNEKEFSQKDPDSYKKFVQYRTDRIQQIAIDLSKKFERKEPTPADMNVARAVGHKEAIEKFKKEIEQAGSGNVKGGAQTPKKTATEQKTPAEAKQEAHIDKTVSGATPPEQSGDVNTPPAVSEDTMGVAPARKIEDIAKPVATSTVTVPPQPPRDLVKTPDGNFAPGAPAVQQGAQKETVDISFNQVAFAKNDPENYQKFVKELETNTATLTEKYFNSGKFGDSEKSKKMARQAASPEAKKETILKFQKEIEAAGAGKAPVTKEGTPTEQPAPVGQAAGTTAVPEQAPNQPPVATQIAPGTPNTPPGVPAAPSTGGFSFTPLNKDTVKNSFGMGTPTVEPSVAQHANIAGSKEMPKPDWAGPKPIGISKLQALQVEAKKHGITGKVSGKYEGGVLTGITDEAGKTYPVDIKEADKKNVDAARSLRGAIDDSTKLQPAAIDRETVPPKQLSSALGQAPVDSAAMSAAAAMGKNITIQSPPPVVVPTGGGGGGQTMVSPPFTSNIRNTEPTLNKYLSSRYLV